MVDLSSLPEGNHWFLHEFFHHITDPPATGIPIGPMGTPQPQPPQPQPPQPPATGRPGRGITGLGCTFDGGEERYPGITTVKDILMVNNDNNINMIIVIIKHYNLL